MLLNGLFFPKFTASLGLVVFAGRELYRYGYMTKEGPNSKIREMGAYPLNIAEMLIALGLCFVFVRYQFGPFFGRRKLI
jgi:hypothetical protein